MIGTCENPGEWLEDSLMPPDDPALVERDDDLAALVAVLSRPPSVAVVEGEPGSGKTRLVREALAARALRGRRRLVGRAAPAPADCFLAPVIEAVAYAGRPPPRRLGAVTGALRAVLPDLAGVLPPAPPPLDDPRLARHRLVRAAAELLAALGPAILVVEDLQWADTGTLELLRMLGERRPDGLSVVVTGHAPVRLPGPEASLRVRPAPLSVEGTGRLAASVLGVPPETVPRRLAEALYERGGGVPFAVCEDVRLLRGRGLLRAVNGEWVLEREGPSGVPAAVGTEIASRARRLGVHAGAVLEAAAVLGEAADPALVAGVAGTDLERTRSALGEAVRAGLLRDQGPGGAVRFRHELARLAVYEAVPGYRRRGLHAVAARELARTGRAGLAVRAAEHHRNAGDVPAWVRSADIAAEAAAGDGAFGTAHACLLEVLRAGAVPEERRVEFAVKLGWAAIGGVDRGGTTAALLAGERERGRPSPARRAELLLLHVWSSLESAVPGRETGPAAAELRAALPDLAGRPDLHAIALAVLAMPHRLPDRGITMQMAYLSRARAMAARTADPLAHAVVGITTAHILLAVGSPGFRHAIEALPGRGPRPEVNRLLIAGLLDLADTALHLGHRRYALELAGRAGRLAGGIGSRTYELRLRDLARRARWAAGELGPEEQAAVLAEAPDAGDPPHRRLLAAQITAAQGRVDDARRGLAELAERACATGEPAVAVHAAAEYNRVAQADAHRRAGHALARRVLDELARKQLWLWAAPLLPFAPLDLVRGVLPRYRAALAGRDAPLARAALRFAEARLDEAYGDAARAAQGFGDARRGYAALPDPRLAAYACAGEVRARLAAGLPPDAALLRRAWETCDRLGAAGDANRIKQLMRAAGLPVPHRRGRPGYGNRLSPREREVAELAASGQTNRDIAQVLYVSDRTVKFHLANAMRKLGVSSRRSLRDALERDSLEGDRPAAGSPRDHTCRCARCGRRLNPSTTDGDSGAAPEDHERDSRSADRCRSRPDTAPPL